MTRQRHVYLFVLNSEYKIGSAEYPFSRMRAIVRSNPAATMLHYFPSADAYNVERALHRRFRALLVPDANKGREWFHLEPRHVEMIRGVVKADAVEDLPATLQPPPPDEHTTIRIPGDLLDMIRIICVHRRIAGERITPSKYIESIVRVPIERDYARIVRENPPLAD